MCKLFHADKCLTNPTEMSYNRMFIVFAHVIIPLYLKVIRENSTHLWHCRYGYLSFKGLNTLAKK